MDQQQPDLVVGVDFGMTCTGKSLNPAWGTLLASIPAEARGLLPITNTFVRSLLCKFIDRLRICQMDSKMAWQKSGQREQGPYDCCLSKPRAQTQLVGLSIRNRGRTECR